MGSSKGRRKGRSLEGLEGREGKEGRKDRKGREGKEREDGERRGNKVGKTKNLLAGRAAESRGN